MLHEEFLQSSFYDWKLPLQISLFVQMLMFWWDCLFGVEFLVDNFFRVCSRVQRVVWSVSGVIYKKGGEGWVRQLYDTVHGEKFGSKERRMRKNIPRKCRKIWVYINFFLWFVFSCLNPPFSLSFYLSLPRIVFNFVYIIIIFLTLPFLSLHLLKNCELVTPWPGGSMLHSQELSNNSYLEPNQPNSPHW